MRKYETIFISDPDIQDQVRDDLFEKVRNIIANQDGYLIDFDDWGIKKLAYDIKKKSRGHYVCITYGGTGELVKELERNFGLHDYVMRFMTILLSSHITMEQLEKEAEEARSKSKESAVADDNLAEKDAFDDDQEHSLNDKDSDQESFSDDTVSDVLEESVSEEDTSENGTSEEGTSEEGVSENEAENEGNDPTIESGENAEELKSEEAQPEQSNEPDQLKAEDR